MNRTDNRQQSGMNGTDDWKVIYNAYVNNSNGVHRQNLTDLAEALRLATNIKKDRLYPKPEQGDGGGSDEGGGEEEGDDANLLGIPQGTTLGKNAGIEKLVYQRSSEKKEARWPERETNDISTLPYFFNQIEGKQPAATSWTRLSKEGSKSTNNLVDPMFRKILKPDDKTTQLSSPASNILQGAKRLGERLGNNAQYIRGSIESAIGGESTTQQGMQEIAPQANEYSSMPKEGIEGKIDSTITARKGVSSEVGRLQNDAHRNALQEIAKMQERGFSPEQIKLQIGQYAQQGGTGMQRQQRALDENQKLAPAANGWERAGEVGASIAQNLIPIGIAAINPIAGVAAGIANVGLNVAQTGAETSMEVDRYEQQSGKKVTEGQRAGYIAAAMGAEGIIDGVMQGRFLGNVGSKIGKEIGKSSIGSAITNETLRKQALNTAEAFGKNATRGFIGGIAKDAAANAVAGAATSTIQEGAKSIFINPEDLPTLQEIASNAAKSAITGAISGAVLGGVGRGINQAQQNYRRQGEPSLTIGSDPKGNPIEVVGENRQGGILAVTPDGRQQVFSPEAIDGVTKLSPFEFNYASKLKELDKRSGVRDDDFTNPNNPLGYAEQRINEMAKNMGIEARVHPSTGIARGPIQVDVSKPMGPVRMGYFDGKTGEIGIIPDFIENDRAAQRVLMHENYGHKGIEKITGGYSNATYEQIHNSLPEETRQKRIEKYETPARSGSEHIAEIAERGVVTPNVGDYIAGKSRSVLRDVTGAKLPYTDNDLRYMLWQGGRNIDPSNSLEMMIKTLRGRAEKSKQQKKQ